MATGKRFLCAATVAALLASQLPLPAQAASAALPTLPPEAPAEWARLHDSIAGAASLDQARAAALAPTDAALGAVASARALLPFSQDLREAQTRLETRRARLQAADSPAQVADELSGMTLAGLDADRSVQVGGGAGDSCHYSTSEMIAIVLGLILGIIPGLILLALLC